MKNLKFLSLMLFLVFFSLNNTQAQEKKSNDGVYFNAEKMPEYTGGIEALKSDIMKSVKYPEEAKKKGIQGKVFVSFIIDENGKLTNAKIARGVEPSLDKEALRVVNQLKDWSPGMDEGKPVKVSFTLPIQFALDGKKDDKS